MKRIFTIFILICFVFSLTGCNKGTKEENTADKNSTTEEGAAADDNSSAADNSSVAANADTVINEVDDLQTISRKLALQMTAGSFEDTYKRCSLAVKLQMSEEALKQAWNATVDGMGKYVDIYEIAQDEADGFQKVTVILRYEYNGLKIAFTYNDSGKLDGLWLNYSPIEEEAASTNLYEEVKITFGEGDYKVTGILTLPRNVSYPPVAILVPGSGNHDVNETVGANKPFRDIAWGLAEQGIASIRYNERVFLYPKLAQGEFTIQIDSLNDAGDAVSYTMNCSQIDKDKIFIIGHSLGAMMAPKIAADNPGLAGIVLLAGSPRKLEDISYDQVMNAIDITAGLTKAQAEKAVTDTEAAIETIKSLTKGSTQAVLGYPSSYWFSLNQIDIGKLASELTIPIYIAQGSEDFQVFADKDYPAWQELLGGKSNVTLKLYDNLNHLFMTSNGKRDLTEYNIPGKVDQTVIDDIAAWMNIK